MKLTRARLALGAGLLVLAGCDYPTDLPKVEQRWILAVESTTFGVDELLPTGVSISGDKFNVSVDPFSITRTLGTVCASCTDSGGLAVPYPGFSSDFTVDQNLPADVASADVYTGTVQITIQNGFAFDPIQLPSGATGTLTVTLVDAVGGGQLGQVILDGATESLAGGNTVTRNIALASQTIGSSVRAEVSITSPAGTSPTDDVALNTAESIVVTATPTEFLLNSASVDVSGQSVDFDPTDVDMDLDDAFTDRIQQGALILTVTNPFGVSVSGSLTLGSVTKSLNIPSSATSEVTINYSGDELRDIMGNPNVQFSGGGAVSSAGPVQVSPGEEVSLEASLDFTLLIG